MNLQESITTPIIVKASNSITYAAAGSAVAFGLTASEIGVFLSVLIGFLAFITSALTNLYFKNKHFKLVEAYVQSGGERRKNSVPSVCNSCPMVKHRTDYDDT